MILHEVYILVSDIDGTSLFSVIHDVDASVTKLNHGLVTTQDWPVNGKWLLILQLMMSTKKSCIVKQIIKKVCHPSHYFDNQWIENLVIVCLVVSTPPPVRPPPPLKLRFFLEPRKFFI